MLTHGIRRAGHRGKLLVACAAVAVAGFTCVGVALASQHHAPQPPAATAQAPLPPAPLVNSPAAPSAAPSSSAPGSSAASDGSAEPAPSASSSPPSGLGLQRSEPTTIAIPALGVHASFVKLGLNPDGTIQVPDDVTDVGWYTLGPSPGQLGPAVVLGHVDSAKNGAGVFFKLGAMKDGDRIAITRADDSRLSFTVYAAREYSKDDFPSNTVYGNTSGPELRLITCGGRFDRATGHYLSNIVVFARASAS